MRKTDKLDNLMEEIMKDLRNNMIDKITHEDEKNIILIDYFVVGKSVEKIASEWGYDVKYILKIIKENPYTQEELEYLYEEYYDGEEW